MEEKLESYKQAIRATLTSAKNGQTLPELRRSFIDLGIRPSPFEALKICEVDFFRRYPDVGRMEVHNGVPVFFAIPTESDKHIHKMVQQQKKGKVKSLNKRVETAKRLEFKGGSRGSSTHGGRARRFGSNRSGSFSRNCVPSKMALNEIRNNRFATSTTRSSLSRISSCPGKPGLGDVRYQKENQVSKSQGFGRGSPQAYDQSFKSTRPESVTPSRQDGNTRTRRNGFSPNNETNPHLNMATPAPRDRGFGNIDCNRNRFSTPQRDGFPIVEKPAARGNDFRFENYPDKQKPFYSGRSGSSASYEMGNASLRNCQSTSTVSDHSVSSGRTDRTYDLEEQRGSGYVASKRPSESELTDRRLVASGIILSNGNGFEPPDKNYGSYRSRDSDSTDTSIVDPFPRREEDLPRSDEGTNTGKSALTIRRTFENSFRNENSISRRDISFERIRASIEKLNISDNNKVDSIVVNRISRQETNSFNAAEIVPSDANSQIRDEMDDLGDHLRQLALRNNTQEPEVSNNDSNKTASDHDLNDYDPCNESKELFKPKQTTLSACRRMITNHLALNKRKVISSLTSERNDKYNADIVNYNDIKCGLNLSKDFVEDILVLLSEKDYDVCLDFFAEVYRNKFRNELNLRRHRVDNVKELCEMMPEILTLYEDSEKTYIKCLYIRNANEKLAGIFRRRDTDKNPQRESSPVKTEGLSANTPFSSMNNSQMSKTRNAVKNHAENACAPESRLPPYEHCRNGTTEVALSCSFERVPLVNQIYVSGIPMGTTELELRTCLWDFGFVDKVSLKLGYAFVTFATEKEAQAAVEKRFLQLRGTQIECSKCRSRNELMYPIENFKTAVDENLVYVKSVPVFWSDAKLKEVFSVFGKVTSAINKKKGFGFVYFETKDATAKAVRQGTLLVQNVLLILEQGKC